MKKLIILLFLIFFVFGALEFTPAQAKMISPPLIEREAEPGEIFMEKILAINNESADITYYPVLRNFEPEGEDGAQQYFDQTADELYGLAAWIHPLFDSVFVKPGENKELKVEIRVPPDAEPGTHYAALFLASEPIMDLEDLTEFDKKAAIRHEVGMIMLITVKGDIIKEGDLLSFSTWPAKKKIWDRLPVKFATRVKNTGNVSFKLRGEITIDGWFQKPRKIDANTLGSRCLPRSTRRFEATWAKDGNAEVDTASQGFFKEMRKEWANWAIGPMTATMQGFVYDPNVGFTAKTRFWVIPWRTLLSIVVLLLVAYYGILKPYNKAVGKKYAKKMEKKKM